MPLPERFRLTPFEKYQYWETQPGHPNQIMAIFDFEGPLRTEVLVQAAEAIRDRHPMMTAELETDQSRPLGWRSGGIERCPIVLVRQDRDFDDHSVPDLPQVNPVGPHTSRLTVRYGKDRSQWILQTHHTASDGVGGLQVIRELIQAYHQLATGQEWNFRELPTDRLLQRQRWPSVWQDWRQWWQYPVQFLGLFGASKFLFRRPVQLPSSAEVPEADKFATGCLEHQLSPSQTTRLRQLARQSGVTVNSLILAYWMIALDQWSERSSPARERKWYRLVIPTNERTGRDVSLSACNRVSLVYVDRHLKELEFPDRLMHGIHFEMGVMRKLRLTRTMLLALRVMSWMPGVLRRHATTPKCWATSYVTNLGAALNRLNVPTDAEGRAVVDQLTLQRIRLLPPLRPGTPLAMAVNLYAGRLSFSIHYQKDCFAEADAERILNYFLHRIKTIS